MSAMNQELVHLILQFLDEEKFKETVHKLEQESSSFFDMEYFQELVLNGDWDNVEKYLSGFTNIDDNNYSVEIFFKIRKQKYLEALDRKDRGKAVEILMKDLKIFSSINEQLFKEITQFLTLENISCSEDERLSNYGDTKTARSTMLVELNDLLKANPLIGNKLNFPTLQKARLRTLINQSLNWQHQLCEDPKPDPEMKTLFVDHSCGPSLSNGARAIPPGVSEQERFPPLNTHDPALGPSQNPHSSPSATPICLNPQSNTAAVTLKRPRSPTSNGQAMYYRTTDPVHVINGAGPSGLQSQVSNVAANASCVGVTNHEQSSCSRDDFPKTVVMNLYQGSMVKSTDFHPVYQTMLLVGTTLGDMIIWELGSRNRICLKSFEVWDLGACSLALQASLASDYSASINRVVWSPQGFLFGVAFSKHIVHIYFYHGVDDPENHLEIEAHIGSVNDIAFSSPNEELRIVTCGEDKLVKVFDAVSGAKLFTFEGHQSPVYSIIPHHKESIQFILSTDTTGKIKAWLYDTMGSRVDYDAPGGSPTNMAYSADGTRLFSCGVNNGDSYLIEWNESEGSVKHSYVGLRKRTTTIVQFDTANNRILAAGDDCMIKFWDMDNINLVETTDADGGLPMSPCIRFNNTGQFLAVSTNERSIKILANADGVRYLRRIEIVPFENIGVESMMHESSSFGASESRILDQVSRRRSVNATTGENQSLAVSKRINAHETANNSRNWKMVEVNEPSQCYSLRLSHSLTQTKVSRLAYTNSGFALLALSANGMHRLWKWPKTGEANTSTMPDLWQPADRLMLNDISGVNLEDAFSCLAVSKNDSYIISSSGGQICLFNLMTFKELMKCMAPPPVATFFALNPQDNNIVAIGMDDCSIQIYDVRNDQVKIKLNGHRKRITGLAFSNALNVLVSSAADAQLCVWSYGTWEKQTSKYLQTPPSRSATLVADTGVQFHQDEAHLLAVHETQIAIYEAPKLICLKQWVPPEESGPITHATYSCDGQSIYVSSKNGSICVLTASTLQMRCKINLSSYVTHNPSSSVYPLVIAAHPTKPNQFAVGLSDGGLYVIEPIESKGKWGIIEEGGPSGLSLKQKQSIFP